MHIPGYLAVVVGVWPHSGMLLPVTVPWLTTASVSAYRVRPHRIQTTHMGSTEALHLWLNQHGNMVTPYFYVQPMIYSGMSLMIRTSSDRMLTINVSFSKSRFLRAPL